MESNDDVGDLNNNSEEIFTWTVVASICNFDATFRGEGGEMWLWDWWNSVEFAVKISKHWEKIAKFFKSRAPAKLDLVEDGTYS